MTTLNTDQLETPPKLHGFEPLGVPLFRDLWLASIVSNLGGWMQDTAGTWLMTVLTTSPLLIALMQTAASLPVVILGLLAGATADIFDRRRLLIFWQAWMLMAVAILSVLTFFDVISPWILLILTFLLNIGAAMNSPAWQAIVPEVIPRAQLPDAVSLNSAGFNLARALGPALGGLMVALFALRHDRRGVGVSAQFPFLCRGDPGFCIAGNATRRSRARCPRSVYRGRCGQGFATCGTLPCCRRPSCGRSSSPFL